MAKSRKVGRPNESEVLSKLSEVEFAYVTNRVAHGMEPWKAWREAKGGKYGCRLSHRQQHIYGDRMEKQYNVQNAMTMMRKKAARRAEYTIIDHVNSLMDLRDMAMDKLREVAASDKYSVNQLATLINTTAARETELAKVLGMYEERIVVEHKMTEDQMVARLQQLVDQEPGLLTLINPQTKQVVSSHRPALPSPESDQSADGSAP